MAGSEGSPRPNAAALDFYLLSWVAGVMDALSYVRAKVFTANMTGNSVILGLAAAGPERARAFHCLLAILAFSLGVLLGAVLLAGRARASDWSNELKLGLTWELPFVVAFSVLWAIFPVDGPSWSLPLLVAAAGSALGLQSVAVRQLHISGVVTTFITGTITNAITSFVRRRDQRWDNQQPQPTLLLGLVGIYIAAAAAGGFLAVLGSPLAPLLALVALAIVLIRSHRSARGLLGSTPLPR
jgi:uncharacterized membrane protein YoaK (UPF0700 family)